MKIGRYAEDGASPAVKPRPSRLHLHENGLLDVSRVRDLKLVYPSFLNRKSPFMRLPGEIRNEIYVYALGGRTFNIELEDSIPVNYTKTNMAHALLLVSRDIYAETVLLTYRLNTFCCRRLSVMESWLAAMPPVLSHNVTSIQHMTIFSKSEAYYPETNRTVVCQAQQIIHDFHFFTQLPSLQRFSLIVTAVDTSTRDRGEFVAQISEMIWIIQERVSSLPCKLEFTWDVDLSYEEGPFSLLILQHTDAGWIRLGPRRPGLAR